MTQITRIEEDTPLPLICEICVICGRPLCAILEPPLVDAKR